MSATADLKQQLVDAILMLEHAEVIHFNGHFSARIPGSEHFLINSGASVRSALTVGDIVAVDLHGSLVEGEAAPRWSFPFTRRSIGAGPTCTPSRIPTRCGRRCSAASD